MQTLGLASLLVSALGSMSQAQTSQLSPSTAPDTTSWSRLQALPPGTTLHLNGHPHSSCSFLRADADSITCGRESHEPHYPRAGISSVKLAHRTRSTLAGLGDRIRHRCHRRLRGRHQKRRLSLAITPSAVASPVSSPRSAASPEPPSAISQTSPPALPSTGLPSGKTTANGKGSHDDVVAP